MRLIEQYSIFDFNDVLIESNCQIPFFHMIYEDDEQFHFNDNDFISTTIIVMCAG